MWSWEEVWGRCQRRGAGLGDASLYTSPHHPSTHPPPTLPAPQGEPSPQRTTRIFVARIPPSVTEPQFRAYFEAFGKLQDAYMPKV